ncbi:conserved hypothetical protein [Leishmania infantum JPCM5]|uniref:Nrap_protein_-_putative n=2 Tax=Leishmania infantum TaxID=5671 RepID=A0A6L0X707_LEIIN|nr:conserved hypothetical protein [Leishmania infantum JPCM5]CAC9480832.1 Nrap_protein_-_putative [Leishmania infantum]CAM67147.2 conserved hypothetical protein [Leishmania infantum JPCM5]SUZ41020.1 Nrap_protein_-_putative [Leishmania infantum]|eukprot:XP_001464908.2 conserved hypothetical protein [Leishmania infantum JPCM5]
MALQNYNLSWSDQLIERVETHLRDVHSALLQYYESRGYPTEVESRHAVTAEAAAAAGTRDEGERTTVAATAAAVPLDVVSAAGSFLLRTCVYDTPFPDLHAQRGVGADLVLSIPAERCTTADLKGGLYLERRQSFVDEIQAYLQQLVSGAATDEDIDEDNEEGRSASSRSRQRSEKATQEAAKRLLNVAAAARLSRMEVRVVPIHGCYALTEKQILQLRFRRRRSAAEIYETFFVNLHFRPSVFPRHTVSAAGIRKHPYYSYCILEDYLMPHYLKKLHEVCVASAGVRRAIVVLKCWAHHTGLMSAASGHPEALNGFVVAAMVLRLLEEGIVTAGMSLGNVVRAVWVQLSRGFFLGTPEKVGGRGARPAKVSAAEERGEVSVLRLTGELHNILFRTSAAFFKHVVCSSAEEALQHPFAVDVVDRVAFQPLSLRYDVALTIQLNQATTSSVATMDRTPDVIKKSTLWRPPRAEAIQDTLRVLKEALGVRCSYTTAWQTDADRLQVVVQLTSEAEGRNRLTRGPPIEDASAVERFNAFWGADITSTRQFSDGAIYRCVLWTFPEDQGTHTTVALSASTVLRRVVEFALRAHVAPEATVTVLLGGLDGYLVERVGGEWRDAAPLMQRSLLEATKAVQYMLQSLPHGSVPCRIVSFDVIAASERHTEVFPVRPHLALTYTTDDLSDASFAGLSTAPTIEPIHCVLSIDDNHKIPDTMEAIAMMKGAIAAQLSKTLQAHYGENNTGTRSQTARRKAAEGASSSSDIVRSTIRTQCTGQSVDIIYRGYLFRVYVAHYREVSLLRALKRDTEANVLEMKLHWTAQHAKFMRTIAFGHHSYSHAVRLAKRWMSAMYLYEFVQPEAVELLVAHAYLQPAPHTPKTPAGGFLRFVQLLVTHDWSTPLVLPFTDDDSDKTAVAAAALVRKLGDQQGMFIATPYAPAASPFTALTPRPMIMGRLVQLAQSVVAVLLRHLEGHNATAGEVEAFTSSPCAFDFSMKFHPRLLLQPDRALSIGAAAPSVASAQSEAAHLNGIAPVSSEADALAAEEAAAAANAVIRIWQLDELDADTNGREYINQLVEREPAAHAVRIVRAALRERGMMFYDALAPSSLYVVSVSAERQLAKSRQLHDAILQVGRGALLQAPPSAFTPVAETAHDPAAAARIQLESEDDHEDGHDCNHHHHRAPAQRRGKVSTPLRQAASDTKSKKGKASARQYPLQDHKRSRSSNDHCSLAAAAVAEAAHAKKGKKETADRVSPSTAASPTIAAAEGRSQKASKVKKASKK